MLSLFASLYALCLTPIQLVALRFFPKLSGILPKYFFKILAAAFHLDVNVQGKPSGAKSTLFLANHISWLDIIAIGSVLDVRFVAKKEVSQYPVVGAISYLGRTVFINRQRRSDVIATGDTVRQALINNDNIVLFAEGTSSDGLGVLPFKPSLVAPAIALSHTASIQPLAIAYTKINDLQIPRSQRATVAWIGDMGIEDNFWTIINAGRITVQLSFGSQISDRTDRKQVTKQAEQSVRKMVSALNRDLPFPNASDLV